jgi:hypothetical protein
MGFFSDIFGNGWGEVDAAEDGLKLGFLTEDERDDRVGGLATLFIATDENDNDKGFWGL